MEVGHIPFAVQLVINASSGTLSCILLLLLCNIYWTWETGAIDWTEGRWVLGVGWYQCFVAV